MLNDPRSTVHLFIAQFEILDSEKFNSRYREFFLVSSLASLVNIPICQDRLSAVLQKQLAHIDYANITGKCVTVQQL